ncbi:MBL fold metallo-hydrolase [Piscinibacter sp. HJYY11]|uniref:MBL fold metallo-hydrolase n=1 Tax=Piscinibacter sp. HJYY11 TaxID=2801333 RepID=UPI00191ECF5A|nr:MBL fold metallo-hydrolase [Piscinibacter sp. HJYY11]MBL0729886.1 MBL fold metallo-hydrolase [Piscinibacter sp. HJYY11]
MTHPLRYLSVLTVLLSACASSPPSSETMVQARVARATQLAGDELKPLLGLCRPQPATRASGPSVDEGIRRLIAQAPPAPGQAFDNLYFVGSAWVSAWVLKTSQGLILIDALNNDEEAKTLIEGGMAKLGLDPRDIRYIVVTHGHGDHYGGASYLARRHGARIVASEEDWAMMAGTLEFASTVWPAPPQRDIAVRDGDKLVLGDTTLSYHLTPGHTLGTLSLVFDVRDGTRQHRALLWGGTAFNFGKDVPRLQAYHASTEKMRRVVVERNVDVMLSNHPGYDSTVAKLAELKRRAVGGAHPFVGGIGAVDRSLRIMGECSLAQRDRFGA